MTTRGLPRRRGALPMPVRERNRRILARYYQRRDRFFARGLTSRGTRRINKPRRSIIEQSWRQLRDQVVMPRAVSWDVSEYELES
ncbi:MAG: hypothetical protein KGL39_13185 [Patescibacteria group bacterium]|nr:hypothetical protein [Patescibacteria group bacterium]